MVLFPVNKGPGCNVTQGKPHRGLPTIRGPSRARPLCVHSKDKTMIVSGVTYGESP